MGVAALAFVVLVILVGVLAPVIAPYDPAAIDTRPEAELIAEYGERFRDAVRMRLMADVPLGMFLSGGIDSASITAAMSTLVDEPIKTFSVAFAEREANELAYARLVAERYRTDHHEIVVSPGEFFGEIAPAAADQQI